MAPSDFSDLPAATTMREEPSALSPLAAIDGMDISSEPPARADDEPNVAAEG